MNEKKGWSFCIVTAPGNGAVLQQCVEKIYQEFSDNENFEILIVGGTAFNEYKISSKVKNIPFDEEILSFSYKNFKTARKNRSLKKLFFRTGAICHKKNLAAREARYDKLCIMHDYVGLVEGWINGFERFGEEWDVAMTVVLNADGSRHRDWMCWNHPLLMSNTSINEACLMPYDTYSKHMYLSGTYFCVKKEFFLKNPLNEKLFWGEGEDVEWSMRVRDVTQFKMNTHSCARYLKLKNLSEAPYCHDWQINEKKLLHLIANKKTF